MSLKAISKTHLKAITGLNSQRIQEFIDKDIIHTIKVHILNQTIQIKFINKRVLFLELSYLFYLQVSTLISIIYNNRHYPKC